MENDKSRRHDHGKSHHVVPLERFTEIEYRKAQKDGERNHFLDGFEFRRTEVAVADTIGRHLKAVFKEGNEPADDNDVPESDFREA